ncbi:MAG: hypothetical protein QM804_16105 [Propionicimonas sp.]
MFAALLKNEARLQARSLASYLGVALAIYAGGILLLLLRVPLMSSIGSIAAVGACLLLGISIPVLLVWRYYSSMYGREGYLTHALPAKHTTLYGAKFSWALGVWLVSLVIAAAMVLGYIIAEAISAGGTAADAWNALTAGLAEIGTAPVTAFLIWLLIGIVIYVAQFGWIITFGMEERFRSLGLGGPVLVWFLTYVVLQVLTLASLLLIPIGVTLDLKQLVFSSFLPELIASVGGGEPSFIPLGWLPLLAATLPVYIVWTLRSLKNHTSLR